MHKRSLVALATAALAALPILATSLPASASSHREAPTIATDPVADNTDTYAFVSPDNSNTVTFVANYIGLEVPAGGPNFYAFGDDVLYQIHLDNVGDAKDHIVFSYRFKTAAPPADTFLYNDGLITNSGSGYSATFRRAQTYTLTETVNGVDTVLGSGLAVPPDNVGPRSVGNATAYDTLAKNAIVNLPGGIKSFAGQRSESFFVDLGGVFDFLSIGGKQNYLAGLNVHSLVINVPKTLLDAGSGGEHIVGVWATSSRQAVQTRTNGKVAGSGAWVQVSRLGAPLVNEVVIPLALKDAFNGLHPQDDHTVTPAVNAVKAPILADYMRALFDPDIPTSDAVTKPRNDLVVTFLTGIKGLNQPTGGTAAEELRLNYSIASSSTNPNAVNRLGVLGGQFDGYPNGRRLADDVTDISLQAMAGILCDPAHIGVTKFTQCRSSNVNQAAISEGVPKTDQPFQTCFPYLANPHGIASSDTPVSTCPGAVFPAASASQPVVNNQPLRGGLAAAAVLILVAIGSLAIYRRKANA